MSDEYQQRPAKLQDTEKPGEREEMERRRKEREEFEKRFRGVGIGGAVSASEYGATIPEIGSAKDYITDKVSVVGDKFKELQNTDLADLAENAKDYARTNPGKAMLIAAGAGLLLGLLIRGRS